MAEPVRTSSRRRARRRQRRRAFVIGVAIVIVAAGAGTAWAMTRSSAPTYRLAAVERANVTQTVDADGTIATINQSALSFATSGTVASVRVATGDSVRAGQIVATLDRADLQSAVVSADQTLADAKQKLADDEAAQAAAATTASATTATTSAIRLVAAVARPTGRPTPTPTGGTGGSGGSGGSGSGGSSSAVAVVKQAQHLVEKAQRELDAAITDQDLAAVASSCVETDGTPATVSTTASDAGNVTGTVGGSVVTVTLLDVNGNQLAVRTPTSGTYSFTGLTAGAGYQVRVVTTDKVADPDACAKALQTVQDKARALATAEHDLGSAVDALTKAVTALRTSGTSGGSSAPTGSGKQTGSPPGGSTGSGSSRSGTTRGGAASNGAASNGAASSNGSGATSGGTSTTITAQQIVADQKSIDAARAELSVAKQDRGLAVLRAPIAGQVADLSISNGQSVGTSTAAMSIVGAGRKSVQVDVPLTNIGLVKAGETANVTVDGLSRPLAAAVTQVGLINTSSSTGSSATYAVTIVLQQTAAHLYDGMGASVSIDVGTAKRVLSVPSSAVHTIGSFSTVDVYSNGKATAERVTLGVKGSDRVEVRSGLKDGQRVVLAVVSAAVPSSSSANSSRFARGGLTSGLGGGSAQRGAFFGGGTGR